MINLELKPIPSKKRFKCLDPKFGVRCRWGSPTGTVCRFRLYGGRVLVIDPKTRICQNFGLKQPTHEFKAKRKENL